MLKLRRPSQPRSARWGLALGVTRRSRDLEVLDRPDLCARRLRRVRAHLLRALRAHIERVLAVPEGERKRLSAVRDTEVGRLEPIELLERLGLGVKSLAQFAGLPLVGAEPCVHAASPLVCPRI